jgi:hypothetical protein
MTSLAEKATEHADIMPAKHDWPCTCISKSGSGRGRSVGSCSTRQSAIAVAILDIDGLFEKTLRAVARKEIDNGPVRSSSDPPSGERL